MIPYCIYQSSLCFWQSISFGIGYNCLYWLGYSLMWFPICYSCIVSGIFMPFSCPWCPRVFGWVSNQPGFIYPLDILQGSSRWVCLSLSLVNHFLWLILRVQSLYSLVGYWIIQFQRVAIVHRCFFLLCHPILGSFLNLPLSAFRAFRFCSDKLLDTSICIHCLQRSYTVPLIVRLPADVSWWKHFCFLVYGFLTLSLFCARLRFVFSARVFSHWLVKQLFNCLIHYILEIFYEFHLVSPLVDLWQTFFIFWFFLITFMMWGWLFCHLLLLYFSSTVTWLSCHFMSFWWQALRDLLPCVWWNLFHHSLFHSSFCNVPDILHVWCFSSRFPYCVCLTFWCRRFFFCILSMISSCLFAYWYMLGHTCHMISLTHSCSWLQCLPQLPIGI